MRTIGGVKAPKTDGPVGRRQEIAASLWNLGYGLEEIAYNAAVSVAKARQWMNIWKA